MFSWYKYRILNLVFFHLGVLSGDLFLIAPFPDHCLLVPFYSTYDMLSLYWHLIVILVFATSVLDFCSDCTISSSLLPLIASFELRCTEIILDIIMCQLVANYNVAGETHLRVN